MNRWWPDDELWYWSPARAISLLVALVYLVIGYWVGDARDVAGLLMFLILPLACIWFPEPMGDFIGSTGEGYIDRPSPEGAIFVAGWVFLSLPVLVLPLGWFFTR